MRLVAGGVTVAMILVAGCLSPASVPREGPSDRSEPTMGAPFTTTAKARLNHGVSIQNHYVYNNADARFETPDANYSHVTIVATWAATTPAAASLHLWLLDRAWPDGNAIAETEGRSPLILEAGPDVVAQLSHAPAVSIVPRNTTVAIEEEIQVSLTLDNATMRTGPTRS